MNILPLSFRGLLTNGSTLAYMGQRAGRPDDPPNKYKYIDENGVFHQTVRTTTQVDAKPDENKTAGYKYLDENGVFHQIVITRTIN